MRKIYQSIANATQIVKFNNEVHIDSDAFKFN